MDHTSMDSIVDHMRDEFLKGLYPDGVKLTVEEASKQAQLIQTAAKVVRFFDKILATGHSEATIVKEADTMDDLIEELRIAVVAADPTSLYTADIAK